MIAVYLFASAAVLNESSSELGPEFLVSLLVAFVSSSSCALFGPTEQAIVRAASK